MRALTIGFILSTFVFATCGDDREGTPTDTSTDAAPSDTSGAETSIGDTGQTDTTVPDTTAPDTTTAADTSVQPDSDAATTDVADTSDDTKEPSACDDYPLAVYGSMDAKLAARAELSSWVPTAVMTWNDDRGALQSISALNVAMPECVDGEDFGELAWDLLLAHNDVFQLDPSEWQDRGPLPCSVVGDTVDFFTYGRATIGGMPVRKDVFTLIAIRVDGVVHLRGVNAYYLPKSSPELTAQLASCPELDTAAALAVIGKTELPYATFAQCIQNGEGTYLAHADDTIEFDAGAYWLWDDSPDGGVRFQKLHDGRLIVAEANRSQALVSSDANCPAEPPATGRIIGFRITFDPVTGALVMSIPGIGCIVC